MILLLLIYLNNLPLPFKNNKINEQDWPVVVNHLSLLF